MKKTICFVFVIALIANFSYATPLLWRGAKTIGKGKFIGMVGLGYWTVSRTYNDSTEDWTDIPDVNQTDCLNAHFMLGYAPINKMEIMAHIPVMSKSSGDLTTVGLQDAWIKTRYGFTSGREQPYVTGVLAVRFPTASEEVDIPLDDRSIDIAAGVLFMKSMNPLVLHTKVGYWYNMKNAADIEVDDQIEVIFKPDYIFSKTIKAFLNFSFMYTLADNEIIRLNIIPGVVVKTVSGLNIRPKFFYPLEMVNKGGGNFAWKIGLDIWFVPK